MSAYLNRGKDSKHMYVSNNKKKSLQDNTIVKSLDIRGNAIGIQGARAVADMLSTNTAIYSLVGLVCYLNFIFQYSFYCLFIPFDVSKEIHP